MNTNKINDTFIKRSDKIQYIMKQHSIFQRHHALVLWLAVSLLTFHWPVSARDMATDTTATADTVMAKLAPMAAAATPTASVTPLNLSGTVSGNKTYTSPEIISSQIIESGSVVYTASDITLGPGFEVKGGAQFEINMTDEFNQITMLTYNLKGMRTLYTTHGKYIKQFKPAVVSLQEIAYKEKFENLKDACGLEGDMCVTIYVGADNNEDLQPIAIKYGIGMLWDPALVGNPIKQQNEKIKIDSKIDGDGHRAFMVAEFRYLCFVATHFSTDDTYKQKMATAILNNAIVKDCMAKGKPVYVAGDMNEHPGEGSMKIFENNGFTVLNDTTQSHATGPKKDHIDLILEHNVNPNHRWIDRGIPLSDTEKNEWEDKQISDHFPYRVKVKIR